MTALPLINILDARNIEELSPLWAQLHDHHRRVGSHLEALASMHEPAETWRMRRNKYEEWLRSPLTRVFVARESDRLLGYAMVRVVESPGSWQWGDRVGVLETLVVDAETRGAGTGRALVSAARNHLQQHGVAVMHISVLAGNDAALRFYEREGAIPFLSTVVMPTSGS